MQWVQRCCAEAPEHPSVARCNERFDQTMNIEIKYNRLFYQTFISGLARSLQVQLYLEDLPLLPLDVRLELVRHVLVLLDLGRVCLNSVVRQLLYFQTVVLTKNYDSQRLLPPSEPSTPFQASSLESC